MNNAEKGARPLISIFFLVNVIAGAARQEKSFSLTFSGRDRYINVDEE
jgi:hypothetical protein